MAQITTNELKAGIKIDMDGQPFNIVSNEYVKPGKGQAFNRVKLKHLKSGRVVEKTYKSGDKLDLADIEETEMRLLYIDQGAAIFMNDDSYEQISIPLEAIGDNKQWLMDDKSYYIVFHNGEAITIEPPTFMEMLIAETSPGVRGDTASGRVLKPAVTESGATIQIPIFADQGEKVKVDTRTGEYVSRASE